MQDTKMQLLVAIRFMHHVKLPRNYGANLRCLLLVMVLLRVVMPSVFTLADPPEVVEDRRVIYGVNVLSCARIP